MELVTQCRDKAALFFNTRKLAVAEDFLTAMEQSHRYVFVKNLVSLALSSDDYADAYLVASLFSQESVRRLCRDGDIFARGFQFEIFMLEDTALDVPHAYRLMATMMHACGMDWNAVEDLSSRIAVRDNPARERFLHEYLALSITRQRDSKNLVPADGEDDTISIDGPYSDMYTGSSDVGYAY